MMHTENQNAQAPGATPEEWAAWQALGLTTELLPVVSDPNAKRSEQSAIKEPGKVPSRFNSAGEMVGIPKWPTLKSADADVERWLKDSRLGICLQGRIVKGFDIDIADPVCAAAVADAVELTLGKLPMRGRANSGKRLLAFRLAVDFPKRIIKTAHGNIELLSTGQQFIVCGTHPSGVRYEWAGGVPAEIPELTMAEVDVVWQGLVDMFALPDGASEARNGMAPAVPRVVGDMADPLVAFLDAGGWVTGYERDGKVNVRCPFEDGHSMDSGPSSTTYFPAGVGGFAQGHWHCLHGSCAKRNDGDYLEAVGYVAADFEDLTTPEAIAAAELAEQISNKAKAARFEPVPWHAFTGGRAPGWLVRGVLPQAELAVIYGESGSGKTFFVLDLAAAIARGVEWRGRSVRGGRVVYICAEGASGFRKRLQAYGHANGLEPDAMQFDVIAEAPDLLGLDHKALATAIGSASVIVLDTLARSTPGANENSGEDMGKALAHCGALHRATGALIVLIHHSGKDAARGARGWSGLKGACDAEIEVTRAKDARSARISKQKDGDEGEVLPFKLQPLLLGLDDEGSEITSCTVVACDAPPVKRADPKGDVPLAVWILAQEITKGGAERVPEEALVLQAVERLPQPAEDAKDRRRDNVKRAIGTLIDGGFLFREGDQLAIF